MELFKGATIYLRPIEREDATTVVIWENDVRNWRVTNTDAPYSLTMIMDHIDSSLTFRQSGVLRLLICLNETDEPIGILDLYNTDFKHEHATIGILIGNTAERGKGYATEALQLLINYCVQILALHNLSCSIMEDNVESIRLFEKVGFKLIGTRKEWFKIKDQRIDERIYQLCLNELKNELDY